MTRALVAGALVAAALAGIAVVKRPALAQTSAPTHAPERSIKAAYLYKFAGYVDWPASRFRSNEAPILIGVAGDAALAEELGRISAGRTIAGRSILAREINADDAIDELEVLFVAGPDSSALERLLAAAAASPEAILTVTETERLPDGSVINFVADHDRVRFEVALQAAEREGLKLNSRLLAVASRVYRGPAR
ncbi:MAG TPA: YfiR family protein [Gammaproteobacteria bacterium]|nr:YfiR family protein [Gammaproteobacteria bacterium]